MDQSESGGSSQSNDNQKKASDEKELQTKSNAVAKSVVVQTADILKLDIDCCEEAFDYLPFEDLVRVGGTCKRLQQVAGYCFQQSYSGYALCNKKGIDAKHLAPFIRGICICCVRDGESLQHFFDAQSKFKRLKQIDFRYLKSTDMIRLNKISMGKLEALSFYDCELSNNFHEIINDCVNLKRLAISHNEGEYDFIDRQYPTLEHFEFIPYWYDFEKVDRGLGVPMFLESNPNIRNFGTSARWFWKNHDKMMTANIKLDNLAIGRCSGNFDSVFNLLNNLHERGFYRKLHFQLTIYGNEQTVMNQLINLKGLVKLFVKYVNVSLTFPTLNNLEELYFECGDKLDSKMIANNLVNLKHVEFYVTTIDSIMPFIRQSVELCSIKICFFGVVVGSVVHLNEPTNIDLVALNREREQLPDAQKLTLFVDERVYLATKWALKETELSLIRLKRETTHEWDQFTNTWI